MAVAGGENRFSEVVKRTVQDGPQEVTVRGKRAVVVVSADEYDRLTGKKQSFIEQLLSGPAWDKELVDAIIDRAKWQARDIEF